MPDWVILLEATWCAEDPLSAAQVRRLQDALDPDGAGGAIRAGDRYALQVTSNGAGPVEALLAVVSRWVAAARDLSLPPSRLIRTEVCTPEELEQQFEPSDRRSDDLLRRAFSDPLTGLLGREAFVRQIEVTLSRIDVAAVVYLDLDGFRDEHGAGGDAMPDHVMVTVSRRLAGLLRPGDVLARIGPGAFGVLLPAGEEAGLLVARRLLAAARSTIEVRGGEVVVAASAGVAVGRRHDAGAAVFGHAEAALAAASAAGSEPLAYRLQMPAVPEREDG